jgi:hypothetical protein
MESISHIIINLDSISEGLRLFIDSRNSNTLFDALQDAKENNEARFQLVEGCYYDFYFNQGEYSLGDIGENIIQQHKRLLNAGTIAQIFL